MQDYEKNVCPFKNNCKNLTEYPDRKVEDQVFQEREKRQTGR